MRLLTFKACSLISNHVINMYMYNYGILKFNADDHDFV